MPLTRPTQVIGTDLDATKVLLVTCVNRDMGLEAWCEFTAMVHRVLPGCYDFRKRELIDW
jgi:hypothetical protein